MSGVHKFVGIFPAGISKEKKEVPETGWQSDDPTHNFVDPWFKQHGPEILFGGTLMMRLRDIPLLLGTGAATVGIIGKFGGALIAGARGIFSVSQKYPDLEGFNDYWNAIWDIPRATIRFDSAYRNSIGLDNGVINNPEFIMNQPSDFNDNNIKCPNAFDFLNAAAFFGAPGIYRKFSRGNGFFMEIRCPVSVKISGQSEGNFVFDYVNDIYSGDFPVIGISIPKEDGTRIIELVIFKDDFNVEIEAMDNGRLTLHSIDPNMIKLGSYEDIKLKINDVYRLSVTMNTMFPELIGPRGIRISPKIENLSGAMPWIPLLLTED
jgi:hypothetical protein